LAYLEYFAPRAGTLLVLFATLGALLFVWERGRRALPLSTLIILWSRTLPCCLPQAFHGQSVIECLARRAGAWQVRVVLERPARHAVAFAHHDRLTGTVPCLP
jgi:hypothetical protein